MKPAIEIRLLEKKDHEAYRQFLQQQPDVSYGHSLEVMDLITNHFRFSPQYLIAWTNGTIKGALPLFKTTSIIEGTRFVSIPFFPTGGFLGESNDVKKMLLEKAKELSKAGKFLEIRQAQSSELYSATGFVKQSPITDFLIDLKRSDDEMFASFSKDVRYDIRKAQRNNLKVIISGDKKQLDDFYTVYLNTRKKRGVPAWPYPLFNEALQTCRAAVAVTYLESMPVAAAFLFFDKEMVEYAFAGTDYRYNRISPYYLLLWEIIRYGIANGYSTLDLGGSTKEMNEGKMYAFKEKWATRTTEISYYFYAADPQKIPSLQKSFGVYQLYGKIWGLLPKKLIKMISPYIIRQFK